MIGPHGSVAITVSSSTTSYVPAPSDVLCAAVVGVQLGPAAVGKPQGERHRALVVVGFEERVDVFLANPASRAVALSWSRVSSGVR